MRFEKENHKYFTLLEHLEDGPEGVGARITRITPRLRLAAALTRYGEYRMLPCFGWMILIVRDHKNEKHDEKRN